MAAPQRIARAWHRAVTRSRELRCPQKLLDSRRMLIRQGLLVQRQLMAQSWQPAGWPVAMVAERTAIDATAVPAGPARAHARPVRPPSSERGTPEGELPGADVEDDHREVWALVVAAQAGDGEAFGKIYDRYVDVVYRFLYYRVNDRGLAEDFTSETFLRALRRISGVSYQGRDIGAWLITIARNLVLDHVKSARNRLEVTTGEVLDGDERAPSPEAAVLETLRDERLMAAVAQLGDEQRECVTLRFIQGLSVSETAQAMAKNDGAVKALQHRAVRKLAELIGNDL